MVDVELSRSAATGVVVVLIEVVGGLEVGGLVGGAEVGSVVGGCEVG